EPIAKGYRAAVPTPARKGVRNVLRNLKTPTNLANELLQGDLQGAGNVVTRASVNTILGVGGLFDIAGHEGIPYHSEDFGQTLAVWGVDHGPYLVIPFFGPGSVRDYAGTLVDVAADPLNHWMLNTGRDTVVYVRAATTFVDTREGLLDVLSDLRNNSIDYYATLRSVYAQNRNNLISDGKASAEPWPEFE
ncbi:MAG: MlaA family lipoprotein, partial [Bdellovibrionales bacterium]